MRASVVARAARSATVALLICLTLTSCGAQREPVLTEQGLLGTWVGTQGKMSFLQNHAFVAQNLKLSAAFGRPGCNTVSASGTWQFVSSSGVSALRLDGYSEGKQILTHFSSGSLALCTFDLITWSGSHSRVTLCFYSDPDSPCISPVFKKVA